MHCGGAWKSATRDEKCRSADRPSAATATLQHAHSKKGPGVASRALSRQPTVDPFRDDPFRDTHAPG